MNAGDVRDADFDAAVRREIARLIGTPEARVTPGASLAGDLDVDSLLHISIVMGLERLFDVSIPDTDATRLATVGDVIEAVRGRLGRG